MSPTISTAKAFVCVLLTSSLHGMVAVLSPDVRHLSTGDASSPDWTYRRTNDDGHEPYSPSEWHLGYPDCGGNSQSPINLSAGMGSLVEASEFDLEFFGTECTSDQLEFSTNENHWLVNFEKCDDPPHLSFDGEAYSLVQMHIHSPSEHMIGGSCHDAEMHLVHTSEALNESSSDVLVVGVFLDAREYGLNVEIQPLWDVLNTGATTTNDTQPAKAYDMLPANPVYSHYVGSLTTPPCTEGVKWVIMNSPTVIGKMQLEEFRTSVAVFENSKVDERSNTNRPAQPINDRTVYIV